MTHEPEPGPDIEGLRARLRSSAEFEQAASALQSLKEEREAALAQRRFKDASDFAAEIERLKADLTEACDLAQENASAASAAEARVTSLERQVKGLEESKADAERMLDAYDAPTRDDGDGGPLSIAGRIEAMAYVISLALTQSDGPGSTGKGS